MDITEMKNLWSSLGAQVRDCSADLLRMAGDKTVSHEEINAKNEELADLQTRLTAAKAAYDQELAAQSNAMPVEPKKEEKPMNTEILKSNEYARAFAYALRNGITPRNGRGVEQVKILFDAMTETGGDPAGTDGGFLVPVDIDNQIHEKRRELRPLADLFSYETVTAPTGWRVVDTAPTSGMSSVDEMGTIASSGSQPAFAKVAYSLTKYGLIVPVSNELMTDNVANLFGYLANWFAKKQVLTENALIIGALDDLDAASSALNASNPLGSLKTVFNVTLDPAIAANSVIITNQSGFNALDQMLDGDDRPLLQPDPTNPTLYRVLGHDVRVLPDAQLPNLTSGTGNDATTSARFYIGDATQYACLFTNAGFQLTSTDIGGSAFRTDSTEVRGLIRMGIAKFDTDAMVCRTFVL